MNSTQTLLGLSTLLCLINTAYALPKQQEVKGNLSLNVNGQKTQLIFKENEDEAGLFIIKTPSQQQQFALAELPFEKSRWIYFQDYNFDGYTDVAISVPDMGMGVYRIFDLFLYQPKTKSYQVVNQEKFDFSHSKCVGFTDLKLIAAQRQMTSSCRGGARWWTDTYQFKNNRWQWIKANAEAE